MSNGQPAISPKGSAALEVPGKAPALPKTPVGGKASPSASTQVEYLKSPSQSRELNVSDFIAKAIPGAAAGKPVDATRGFRASAFEMSALGSIPPAVGVPKAEEWAGSSAFGGPSAAVEKPDSNKKRLNEAVQAGGLMVSFCLLQEHHASAPPTIALMSNIWLAGSEELSLRWFPR